jgi:D-alanyl-D-alanine carboxypeptidase
MLSDIWHQKGFIDMIQSIKYKGAGREVCAFFVFIIQVVLVSTCLSSCVQDSTSQVVNHAHKVVVPTEDADTLKQLTETLYSKNDLLGKFDPASHPDFVRIDKKYTSKEGIYMRKETYEAYQRMHDAAAKDGVQLIIISATRNFNYQKGIWERKWNDVKLKGQSDIERSQSILRYSSMPGTSRHHWGTDLDFNSVSPSYFTTGNGKKLYNWLVKNAANYGFAQTYTSKNNGRTGYNEEVWHWSYMPLSHLMLQQYNQFISYDDLTGYAGASTAKDLKVIELYVNGIDEQLKK